MDENCGIVEVSASLMAEQPPEGRRFLIGYALASKKRRSFIRPSLINLAKDRGIDLIKIDCETPLIDQGPFDCVLHKLYGDDWKRQLTDYKSKHPNVMIIDAPESIERLHNRISMLQVVSEIKVAQNYDESFGIPRQIVIYDVETLRDPLGLKFPVIAKPLVADGSAKSHKMSLVYNHEGLLSLKPPIVLQEFVNHGGVIFKVYVVGDKVKCVKRKSLPDVTEDVAKAGVLTFSQISNLSSNERIDENKYYKMMRLDDCEMPPQKFIADIARGLRGALKLNLFNFDVIRDTRLGNRYLVIDINYFPGYAKMPAYESVLTDFFWDVVSKEEGKDASVNMDMEKGSDEHSEVDDAFEGERKLADNVGSGRVEKGIDDVHNEVDDLVEGEGKLAENLGSECVENEERKLVGNLG